MMSNQGMATTHSLLMDTISAELSSINQNDIIEELNLNWVNTMMGAFRTKTVGDHLSLSSGQAGVVSFEEEEHQNVLGNGVLHGVLEQVPITGAMEEEGADILDLDTHPPGQRKFNRHLQGTAYDCLYKEPYLPAFPITQDCTDWSNPNAPLETQQQDHLYNKDGYSLKSSNEYQCQQNYHQDVNMQTRVDAFSSNFQPMHVDTSPKDDISVNDNHLNGPQSYDQDPTNANKPTTSILSTTAASKKREKTFTITDEGFYQCKHCPRIMENIKAHDRHYTFTHNFVNRDPKEGESKCEICFKCVKTSYLPFHIARIHHSRQPKKKKPNSEHNAFHLNALNLRQQELKLRDESDLATPGMAQSYKKLITGQYQCLHCPFKQPNLRSHKQHYSRIHRYTNREPKEGEVKCKICQKCVNSRFVQWHLETFHPLQIQPPEVGLGISFIVLENGRYQCLHCAKSNAKKGSHTIHFNRMHKENKKVQCSICSKLLTTDYLQTHMKKIHKVIVGKQK